MNSVLLKLMAEHMFSEETKQKVVQKLNENVDIPIISEATEEKIIEAMKKFDINATPTLIINGKKFDKSLNYKNIKKALEKLI